MVPDESVPASGLTRWQRLLKRSFDIVVATGMLLTTGWLIALVGLMAAIDTRSTAFFTQVRVGRNGRSFRVIKIRTMRNVPAGAQTTVTTSRDPRITRLGRRLRRMKLDELPQLFNVLRGQMSLVGPRPDVPGFVDALEGRDRIVLSVRPGITGPATLRFRDEEAVLASQDDPERYNREVIFPEKVRLNRQYVEEYRFVTDLVYLWKTIRGGRR